MERITIHSKGNIMEMLQEARRDINNINKHYFMKKVVSEFSAIKTISFDIRQEARLKEIGALSEGNTAIITQMNSTLSSTSN